MSRPTDRRSPRYSPSLSAGITMFAYRSTERLIAHIESVATNAVASRHARRRDANEPKVRRRRACARRPRALGPIRRAYAIHMRIHNRKFFSVLQKFSLERNPRDNEPSQLRTVRRTHGQLILRENLDARVHVRVFSVEGGIVKRRSAIFVRLTMRAP